MVVMVVKEDVVGMEVVVEMQQMFGFLQVRHLFSINLLVQDTILMEVKEDNQVLTVIQEVEDQEGIRQGEWENVKKIQQEVFQNVKDQIQVAFGFLSESEKEFFIKTVVEPNLANILSAALQFNDPDYQELQYEVALLIKGIQLKNSTSTLQFVLQQQDSIALESYKQLIGVRRQLSEQYRLSVEKRTEVTDLEQEQESLEKELARLSDDFRKDQLAANVNAAQVRASLKKGQAAIEFIHFKDEDNKPSDSVYYAAVIILPDTKHAHFIKLFEEQSLKALIKNTQNRRLDFVDELYAFSSRGLKVKQDKPNLYQLIWQPLEAILKDVETVYYSPSGLLHQINIGAIPFENEKKRIETLADRYTMRTMLSTRNLVLEKGDSFIKKNAVIYGGIEYDYDSIAIAKAIERLEPIASNRDNPDASRASDGEAWPYLTKAEKESQKINELLNRHEFEVALNSGYNATEESFKRLGVQEASPYVIHLATHGFFYPKRVDTSAQKRGKNTYKISDNPMIRSGIILAGANRSWMGEELTATQEDGILTAYEISQLNLTNTNLVVLSACETGLGDIRGNEGVFGLQRAFKMAGVDYLIISLWQVNDASTQFLMTTFYKKWLEDKLSIPEAFRAAQNETRELYSDPYFWAGFILLE